MTPMRGLPIFETGVERSMVMMKHLVCSLSLLALLSGCSDEESTSTETADTGSGDTGSGDTGTPAATEITVSSDITADATWASGSIVTLSKLIVVTNNATLTIEPGVIVKGDNASALVISRGAKLNAAGTAASPIIFTSSKPEGSRASGDWGGVVLLGSATINLAGGEGNIEGMPAGPASLYGGTDDASSCGSLTYVRIEFAGYVFGTDNELNGLTVGGCGSATELDFIQSHLGKDDGVEMFGGTANIKHLLVTQATDDSLDFDQGWRGNVQFLAIQQSASVGDKAIEGDNLKDVVDSTPRSRPTIFNASVVGSGANAEQGGLHIRRGAGLILKNSIIANFQAGAVDLDGATVAALVGDSTLDFSNIDFFGNGADQFPADTNDADFDEAAYFGDAAKGFVTVDPQFASTSLTAPDFAAGNTAVQSGGATPPAGGFFDTTATYHGAFAPTGASWTAGWTSFPTN